MPGFLILVRPANLFLGAASIVLGAVIVTDTPPAWKVLLAGLSGTLIMAAGNALNDYYDADIDRLNKPFRAVPSGKVGREAARRFSTILFVSGVFIAIFISLECLLVALFVSLGLCLYNARLKRTFLLGNGAVSLFTALAFIYGGAAAGDWRPALFPAGFAFLFHLGREIVKDIEDQVADRSVAARTLPLRTSTHTALASVTAVYLLLVCLTFVPYWFSVYGLTYLIIVTVGVDVVLLISLVLMWRNQVADRMRRISLVLKMDMIVGLAAIYVGGTGAS